MAGFGVDAAVEAVGRSVCDPAVGVAERQFAVNLDLTFPGVTLPQHPAELFSRQVLLERMPTRGDILHLFHLLPREDASRGGADPLAFGCGCWVHDNRFGLRRNNQLFPLSVQLLNSFVLHIRPCHRWTSLVLFCDVRAPRHRDVRNSFDPNLVVAISDFEGGEIFVVRADGDRVVHQGDETLRGVVLDPRQQPCLLHARAEEHFTLPWTGQRLVLVAFCIAPVDDLSDTHRSELRSLGFRLAKTTCAIPSRPPDLAPRLCLEIFATPPRLSSAFRDVGVRTLALHHAPAKEWSVPCLRWDVMSSVDVDVCVQRLREDAVAFLFVAPPPVLAARGASALQTTVRDFLVLMLATLTQHGTAFCFCLPRAAPVWDAVLAQAVGLTHFLTDVDLCMFGCGRKRSVRLLHNVPALQGLRRVCDGSHDHVPWSAQAPEASDVRSLPPDFCRALVQECLPLLPSAVLPSTFRPSSAATFGSTKLHAAPAVVPEFKECFRVLLPATFDPPECVPEGGCPLLPQVPAGAVRLQKGRLDALTALELRGSEHAPSDSNCLKSCSIVLNEPDCMQNRSTSSDPGSGCVQNRSMSSDPGPGSVRVPSGPDSVQNLSMSSEPALTSNRSQGTQQVVYASHWTTQEFLEKALQAVHPSESLSGCEPEALENISWIASASAADVCTFRTNALKALLQSEAELRREEDLLHKSLHPEVACVLKGKRLLLFRKLARAAGVQDPHLFQEVCEGFSDFRIC